ncbi:MAG: ATP-binding protein [bacterium]|nr:ATP-binding protein [bacterium]
MSGTTDEKIRLFEPEKYLGHVIQVDVGFLVVSGDSSTGSLDAARIGSFVIIHGDDVGFVGQVSKISNVPSSTGNGVAPAYHIQMLVVMSLENGKLVPQGQRSPYIGAKTFSVPGDLVRGLVEASQDISQSGVSLTLDFCRLQEGAVKVHLTPEMMFGRHCAIIGSTGGGKSWSIARMVEQLARYNSKVLLLDASGEYHRQTRGVMHVHIGYDPSPRGDSKSVTLPHSELLESDLFAMFDPQGQAQAPKLRAAIRTLKLLALEPTLSLNGMLIKADKAKKRFLDAYRKHITALEAPSGRFDVHSLGTQIENECVHPNRSSIENDYWGSFSASEYAACIPMINRIEDMVNSLSFSPFFQPQNSPSLIACLRAFIKDPEYRIFCVSLEHLAFQHNVRPMVVNSVGRFLLNEARMGQFQQKPFLIVLDEAHQFLNENANRKDTQYPLDSFRLIANEGRKYGLNLCLATQRPRDIPEDILSQAGTFLVHRLVNDFDRNIIERASGQADSSVIGRLPTLSPGEAILMSCDLDFPLLVAVEPPDAKPDSNSADFQRCWS